MGWALDEFEQFDYKARHTSDNIFIKENMVHMQSMWAAMTRDERAEALSYLNQENAKAGTNADLPALSIIDANGNVDYDLSRARWLNNGKHLSTK